MNIKLDNEFLELFIPENTQFNKDDYIDELKTYIFKIMTYTLNDLVQENINLNDENVNLNLKLKNYLEGKLDLILEVNETFIDTSNKLEIMLKLLEDIKSTLITNSFDDEKIMKIKVLYDRINQIKTLMESNTILLLEIPNILFKCIQNEDYILYLDYVEFIEKYFKDSTNESLLNEDDSIVNFSKMFIVKLKEKVNKITSYCSNFVLNKLKIMNNEAIFNIEIFDIVKFQKDFTTIDLEKFNFSSNDEREIKIAKLLALFIFKIQFNFNKIKCSNESKSSSDQNYNIEKFQKDYRFRLKNTEDFLKFSINLFNCFTFKLKELIKEFTFTQDINNDIEEKIRNNIIETVDKHFIKPYLINSIIRYLDITEKNKFNNEEKLKFSFNTSDHYFNDENHVIMMIKHKFLFLSILLEKINIGNENDINYLSFKDFGISNEINKIFSDYILNIIQSVLKVDSLLKFIHYNRGDTNKLFKIEENSKNEYINLIILNLGFVKDLLSEVNIEFSPNVITKIMLYTEGYIKSSLNILNKYLKDNSFYVKITKDSINSLKNLNSFKKLLNTEIQDIYINIIKELQLDEKICRKFMNSLEDYIN